MARSFSDVFGVDNLDSDQRSDTSTDQNAATDGDASNDGLSFSNASSSRDDDGESSAERTDLDIGGTDLDTDADVDNMVDNLTRSSNSADDLEVLD